MLRKTVLVLSGLSMVVGFTLLIGTAGSLDLNSISLKTGLIQSLVSLGLISLGSLGLAKNPIYIDCD